MKTFDKNNVKPGIYFFKNGNSNGIVQIWDTNYKGEKQQPRIDLFTIDSWEHFGDFLLSECSDNDVFIGPVEFPKF